MADVFARAGHRLFLVGGIVRDDLIGRRRAEADYDLTTDARPEQIKALVGPIADAVWTQGERFGTIGCSIDGQPFEITTHRADTYDPDSRKPIVEFGDDIGDDLARRDFTVNAMAVEIADRSLVDPFDGRRDLHRRRLRTPLDPEISFSDDPLRMVRAARFVATLDLAPDPSVVAAVEEMRDRMAIVSVERVRDELEKMLVLDDPVPGVRFLADTGLLEEILPAVSATDPRLVGRRLAGVTREVPVRWAALLLDADDARRDAELRRLKPSGDLLTAVRWLLGADEWLVPGSTPTDAPRLRRLAASTPTGHRLEDRLEFVAAIRRQEGDGEVGDDVVAAQAALGELRIAEPDLDDPSVPLTGHEIAALLGVEPGPVLGEAKDLLRDLRFAHGPVSAEAARRELAAWWDRRSREE